VAVVKPGRILFEVDGLDQKEAEEAFRLCSYKLPIKTKVVGRREVGN
ncbi:ribosomal protein L16, partial [Candidatus Pelagibacter communis]